MKQKYTIFYIYTIFCTFILFILDIIFNGNKIKELRKGLSLSQTELAEKIGKSLRSIQMYEQDKTEPSGKTLLKFMSLWESYMQLSAEKESANEMKAGNISPKLKPFPLDVSVLDDESKIDALSRFLALHHDVLKTKDSYKVVVKIIETDYENKIKIQKIRDKLGDI